MINVLFVCHGNICRSPMAEFVFKTLVKEKGTEHLFSICSAATSSEEIGNPVHRGTEKKLRSLGISIAGKYAVQLLSSDYDTYSFFLGMDSWNISSMQRLFNDDPQKKVFKLLDFTTRKGVDIADPWYTGNFDVTYDDVKEGCEGFYQYLQKEKFL